METQAKANKKNTQIAQRKVKKKILEITLKPHKKDRHHEEITNICLTRSTRN